MRVAPFSRLVPAVLGAAAGALLAAAAGASLVGDGAPPFAPTAESRTPPVPEGRVRLQCWQQGVRIIDESGLAGTALGLPDLFNALRFRRADTPEQTLVLIAPTGDTVCLIGESG